MKLFAILLVGLLVITNFLSAEEFTTGGIYIQSVVPSATYNLIGKGGSVAEKFVLGKTYYLETDVLEMTTGPKETISIALSTGHQLRVSPDSTFSIDSFNQSVVNNESQPAVLNADYAVSAMTLMDGEISIISPKGNTNSQTILQTPLVNINLAEGKLAIRSNPKYVMLNVIEGSVIVVDSKNKRSVIDKGNMGLIIPYPGRDGETMVVQKSISPDELEKMIKTIQELERQKEEVMFAVIDGKVLGIRLK